MNKDVIKRMIVVGLFLHVCVVTDASSADDFDIKEATAWFVGSYTSEQHSKRDTMFSNESIEVRRIWESREDGHWFSLERFSASNLDTPLQQFVVQLRGVEENMLQMRFYLQIIQRFFGRCLRLLSLLT
jgi:hypothetical protein